MFLTTLNKRYFCSGKLVTFIDDVTSFMDQLDKNILKGTEKSPVPVFLSISIIDRTKNAVMDLNDPKQSSHYAAVLNLIRNPPNRTYPMDWSAVITSAISCYLDPILAREVKENSPETISLLSRMHFSIDALIDEYLKKGEFGVYFFNEKKTAAKGFYIHFYLPIHRIIDPSVLRVNEKIWVPLNNLTTSVFLHPELEDAFPLTTIAPLIPYFETMRTRDKEYEVKYA